MMVRLPDESGQPGQRSRCISMIPSIKMHNDTLRLLESRRTKRVVQQLPLRTRKQRLNEPKERKNKGPVVECKRFVDRSGFGLNNIVGA